MSIIEILVAFVFVVALAAGQILFKMTALQSSSCNDFLSAITQMFNKYLFSGIIIYGIATFLWIWLLRSMALNRAYPIVALAFVLVPIGATVFLGEKLETRIILGGLLIALGVCISVT